MRTRLLGTVAATVAAAALTAPAVASTGHEDRSDFDRRAVAAQSLMAVGLTTDQRLVSFPVATPGKVWRLGKISGLRGDSKIIGVDFRVQNGKLYGVGNNGGVYTFDKNAKGHKVSQLTLDLTGKHFGVDFNPAADRLRVISDTGQNLRHNIDDPAAPRTTTADGTLTNPTTPPSTALGVTGAAYTNNDLSPATATTLFDLDTSNDRVSLQSPANAGTLAPTGNLGLDAGPAAGFDIHTHPRTGTNTGYAALRSAGKYRFHKVDLLSGRATLLGAFPARDQVADIALPLDQN